MVLTAPQSINGKMVLEAYQKEGLKAEVKSGFAMVSQKVSSKGLKVLVEAKLPNGTIVPAGSTAFIKEELLHTQVWATKPLEPNDVVKQPFMVVDSMYVDYVVPPKGE